MESVNICSICFEEFRDPKIIPCFHTFCRDCLYAHIDRVLKNGKFNCPVCRAVIEMPKNGVDEFQSNFYINELTKAVNAQELPKEKEELSLSEADLKSGHCPKHETEKLTLYCELCKVPCCRDCKIESHDGHNSVKLVDMTKKLFHEAGDLLAAIKKKTERTQKQEKNLDTKLKTVESERTKLKEVLTNRKAAIVEKIEYEAEIAAKSLTDLTTAAGADITDSLENIKTTEEKLAKITSSLTQTMESKAPLLLLHAITDARENLDNINTRINIDRLFPGIVIQKSDTPLAAQVKLTIGKVVLKKYPSVLKGQLENVATMDIVMRDKALYIKTILPVSVTEAWITLRSKKESKKTTWMRKLNTNGNVLSTFPLSGLINSMTSLSNGSVAVTMPVENKVCIMEDEQSVYELAGLRNPMGIASYDDDLYVCSVESKELKEIKPYSVNRIVVLSKEGLLKRTIEFFDGNPLFAFPGKVSVTYSGDIIVSDFAKNKLVCLGLDGEPKYEYNGGEHFLCGDVFCDDAGHVLVETSEGIHVLDDNLNLIQRFTTEFPAQDVVAMAVGLKGLIWIADTNCRLATWKYY